MTLVVILFFIVSSYVYLSQKRIPWGGNVTLSINGIEHPVLVGSWFYLDDEADRDYCDKFGLDVFYEELGNNKVYVHQQPHPNCTANYEDAPCRIFDLTNGDLTLPTGCAFGSFGTMYSIRKLKEHWFEVRSSAEGVPGLQLGTITETRGYSQEVVFTYSMRDHITLEPHSEGIAVFSSCELVEKNGGISCKNLPSQDMEVSFDEKERPIGSAYLWTPSRGLRPL